LVDRAHRSRLGRGRLSGVLRFEATPYASGTRHDAWPSFSLSEASTVFSPRPPLRNLTAVVDYELLQALDEESLNERSVLGGLLSHPYITLYRFSDHGPPPEVDRATSRGHGEYAPGWIEVREPAADHVPVLCSPTAGRITWAALTGNGAEVAASDAGSGAYANLAADEAAAQRRADATAVQSAALAKADIFITERAYLHSLTWPLARGIVIATPEQALPLVSLYLRRQGGFFVYRSFDGTATDEVNQGLFYLVGTRGLLPAGWRWFRACVQHGHQDDLIIYLGQSLFQRVQRALQARDAAHWALNQPQTHDTADEALGNLDLVLLGLMAAIDVTARVAHRALGLHGSERRAAWQRESWLREVGAAAPELAAVVAQARPGGTRCAFSTRCETRFTAPRCTR
jgi:hypothetical protein